MLSSLIVRAEGPEGLTEAASDSGFGKFLASFDRERSNDPNQKLDRDQTLDRFLVPRCEAKKMARATVASGGRGPAIRAVDPWASSTGKMRQLLSDEERARMATIASIVRFKKGAEIYRQGRRANQIFNIISGVVRIARSATNAESVVALGAISLPIWV
jgi:hypothetical protein